MFLNVRTHRTRAFICSGLGGSNEIWRAAPFGFTATGFLKSHGSLFPTSFQYCCGAAFLTMPDEIPAPKPEIFHRFFDETGDTTFYDRDKYAGNRNYYDKKNPLTAGNKLGPPVT